MAKIIKPMGVKIKDI